MKSAWLGFLPFVAFSLGAFGACGGTSESSDTSKAGGGGAAQGGSSAGTHPQGGDSAGTTSLGGTGATDAGASSSGGSTLEECNPAECGPQLGLPNWMCGDGSTGGPTGRCIQLPSGSCGWEINDCPPAGQGGAAGQGNVAGAGGAGTDACGGCDASAQQICVYQQGGPGPSHFTCATQLPCGNALACACIQGQGQCQPNLMGDAPGYCVCDNGLE